MLPFGRMVKYGNKIEYKPDGEQLITTIGTTQFTVPAGVTEISVCVISPGGQRGAGGGLSWRNNIPVTSGEYLSVSLTHPNTTTAVENGLYRGTEKLCVSFTGEYRVGGLGGKAANAINDGGGNGGNAGVSGGAVIGGGAGGYTGKGGNGDAITGENGAGGGGGGGAFYNTSFIGTGGGTGIIVQGANGIGGRYDGSYNGGAGSGGAGKMYGGGGSIWDNFSYTAAGGGAVRIIWGRGRYYPNNSV
ncbi:hypothetical protein [Escherichia coli]|uniref:Uncharacterized protein n=2 Tax=Asteriusvirus TaxID=2560094 RepID=A0A5A4U5Y1_9CAUD|nr:hypothetical protein PBI_121Q_243 [Escherichia phage 121Q]EGE5868145.1 hypothetical protein [Escherichia coli]MED6573033.1 hypothetical protein [Escherichia coli O157]BBM61808.1 hypothetical protein EO157G_2190 [Escherichia phage SP27]AIT14133.1 hypothetical protein PBI_121Q_243 [Escherichia phage 121Q]MED6826992.1 hypothetical protein [Escherichia coli O157]